MRIGIIIVFHLRKLWEAKFFVLCYGIFGESAGDIWSWLLLNTKNSTLPQSWCINQTLPYFDVIIASSFGGEIHRGPGEGQCYSKFDGKHGVLAHAYFPENGRIHFDEAESWGDASIWPWHYNLLPTSIHEFGHALGLSHSNVKGSVMWPSYTKNTKLHQSDIARIRNLYSE